MKTDLMLGMQELVAITNAAARGRVSIGGAYRHSQVAVHWMPAKIDRDRDRDRDPTH